MDGSSMSSVAQRAQAHVAAGRYMEAVELLLTLSTSDSGDKKKEKSGPTKSRVQHNLALAQLLAGKAKGGDFEAVVAGLLSEMQVAPPQSSDSMLGLGIKLRKEKESWEDEADFEKARSTVFSGVNLSFQTLSMERDATLLRYNLAACYFRAQKYASASSILDALLRAMEPMDENVAMHICFLYLDVLLASSRGSALSEAALMSLRQKASAILAYLEGPHGFNGLADDAEPVKDAATKERAVSEFKFRLHLYKAKVALLQENAKVAKKEVKTAMEVFQKEIKPKETPAPVVAGPVGVAVGRIFVPAPMIQNTTALYLKAHLEYLRRNFKKSIKLVASCKKSTVDDSIMLNNLGCIHAQQGLHQAAQSYFAKALDASKPRRSKGETALGASVQTEVLYNNGLTLLQQKKFALAFRCFQGASRLYFNRPKLWLRLGECCTGSVAAARAVVPLEYKNSLVKAVVGHGAHRRVVLPTAADVPAPTDGTPPPGRIAHPRVVDAAMTLPYAAKCFRNAVLLSTQLLEARAAEKADGDADAQWAPDGLEAVRQKALVHLAYANLCMHEPHLALATCRELLALPTLTKGNRYLARTYGAEALSLLSRSAEAGSLLKTNEMLVLAEEYAREAHVDVAATQADVHVNNATACLLQKNMAVAEQSVALAVRTCPTSRVALQQLVYVLLRKGNTKKAMQILKEARVTN
ncbi:CCR4-NOT transcription complex subunit [Achlya hypogyna]|uniref:CCR4-NOT transcription complex subunit n=1 Tax=Achlya hypogyna TaxID=1202772 RepID=A0A1V9YQP3_ACHHY|nr:CCR4-NOT transcription complex subunit [Achlya hypogyna]